MVHAGWHRSPPATQPVSSATAPDPRHREPVPGTDGLAGLAALVARAPIGVFAADARGQWLYANDACAEIFGLDAAQLLGLGWLRFVEPVDHEGTPRSCLQDPPAEGLRLECRVARPDGGVRTVVTRLWSTAPRGATPAFVGSVTDFSAITAAQNQLRESLELLDRTGRLAGVGGWVIDLVHQTVRWA
jgi:PAS domain S-box-containing protein